MWFTVTEKKNPGMSNTQSTHAPFTFVGVNKNTVVSGFAMSPGSHCIPPVPHKSLGA